MTHKYEKRLHPLNYQMIKPPIDMAVSFIYFVLHKYQMAFHPAALHLLQGMLWDLMFNSYRPISLVYIFAKILELLVYNKLLKSTISFLKIKIDLDFAIYATDNFDWKSCKYHEKW